MAEYKSSSIDKVQYQGLEIQKIYVGSELFWPIAEGSGGSEPGENPVVDIVLLNYDVNKIPASGGTVSKLNSYTVQVVYKNGNKVEYTDESYITYTNSVSAPSSTNQTEHKVGSLEFTFACPDIEETKAFSVDVYQIAYVKRITGLEIVSFTADEVPWQGGAVVPHLEYLVTYSDGSTSNSDDSLIIEITGTTEVPMNPNITRSEWSIHVWVLSYEYSLQDEKYAYFYQAAVPAESITLTRYDVDDISADGGTVNSLNSYEVLVVYKNNRTYSYTSMDRITYKNSVTVEASTNQEEHLVGYLQFTFTCPYIDSSLDFSVQVYQDAYVPVVETRLAYMQRLDSAFFSSYMLEDESGNVFKLADLFGNDATFTLCASTISESVKLINTSGTTSSDMLNIYSLANGWMVHDTDTGNVTVSTDGTHNPKFFKAQVQKPGSSILIWEYTNETFPTLGWSNIDTNTSSSAAVYFNAGIKVFYIQIGLDNSTNTKYLIPFVNSKDEYYFKDTSSGKKYFVRLLNEFLSRLTSPVSYSNMTISFDTSSAQINKIPSDGGSYESTLDLMHTFVNVEIPGYLYTRYYHSSAYNSVIFSNTGTCPPNSEVKDKTVGTQIVTFKLFEFYENPISTLFTYIMTQEAYQAISYMTNYNLCYTFWLNIITNLLADPTEGSNLHPVKAANSYVIPIEDLNSKFYMKGGIVTAVVNNSYTSDVITKTDVFYYNNAVYFDFVTGYTNGLNFIYALGLCHPTYYDKIKAGSINYEMSGFHNDSSIRRLYEWIFSFDTPMSIANILSDCPWTNTFVWNTPNATMNHGTIRAKIMPGFEYNYNGSSITHYEIEVWPSGVDIYRVNDSGSRMLPALKTWDLSTGPYLLLLDVPVKPISTTTTYSQFLFPERGTMWIGTPE